MNEKLFSLKIKILAIVSVVIFVAGITVAIVVNKQYLTLEEDYKLTIERQQTLEKSIYKQNATYYADLIKNGFTKIPGGSEEVSNVVKRFYGYRLKIDGKVLIEASDYSLSKDFCTIAFEEYYFSHATNFVPFEILDYFSFMKSKGKGSTEPLPVSEIINVSRDNPQECDLFIPSDFDVTVREETEGSAKRIIFEISNMVAGQEISIESMSLRELFNLDAYRFEVRTTK